MNGRIMPWKSEKDPYKIWLSEIILQQTRVKQGLRYYQNFIQAYPDIHRLASAPVEKVYKLWEGLGYYSRCRNLIETARYISNECKGVFPSNYDEILALKGVGPYTAAAISSFAFDHPQAVVDGNVFRVLSRVFGIIRAIDSTEGKRYFTLLANELLDKQQPGIYNQAIMDFGAMICKPVSPLCSECVFREYCKAFATNKIQVLPLKEKKNKIRERWFYYLVVDFDGMTVIMQRNGKDIWKNLYEFLLVETNGESQVASIIRSAIRKDLLQKNEYDIESVSPVLTQQLSHQKIKGRFIRIKLRNKPLVKECLLVPRNELGEFAFPGFINDFLRNHYQ